MAPMPILDTQKTAHLLGDFLHQELPELLGVYLFGSQAQQTAGPDSDVDLAVLVAGYVDPMQLWELSNQLAEKLQAEVDLVDLRAASTVMQHQIVTTGKRIWANGTDADYFELFVLSEKFDLDIWRQPLIDQIESEGRIHGR